MTSRLAALREFLPRNELDALLVSQPKSRRYLSGFTGSAGFLLISQDAAVLATDFRYVEQAQAEAADFDIERVAGPLEGWLPRLASQTGARRIGFEQDHIAYATYRELVGALKEGVADIALVASKGIVDGLRAIKDKGELVCLEKAAELADAALDEIVPGIETGMTERELAWRLESHLRQNGSEPLPFEVIVASGPNAALPHARPTDRPVAANEPIVIDLGARVHGYCSDITRTYSLGEVDSTFHRIYDIVLGAQFTAMETLRVGMTGEQVDQLARTVIVEASHGDAFGHGLGHGVGLAAHEEPRLGPGAPSVLADGMVFTLEPGIYISGWGGVRIEDTVVLEEGKVRPLTRARKVWR